MNPQIESFLRRMTKQIKNSQAREMAKAEIADHMYSTLESDLIKGRDENESVQEILTSFGDPKKLGKKLNIAHRHWLYRYPLMIYSVFFAFSGLAVLIVASYISVSKYLELGNYDPIEKEKFFSRFETDLRLLDQEGLRFTRKKNAHSFLEDKIFEHEKLKKVLVGRGWTKDLASFHHFIKNNKIRRADTSWIREIKDFDHWNFHDTKAIKQSFESASKKTILDKIDVLSKYKFPDMGFVKNVALFESIRMIANGNSREANELISRVTLLLRSTHSILGHMVAFSALERRNMMIDSFNLDWKKTSREYNLAVKRVASGWASIFSIDSFKDPDFTRWRNYMKPELGMCVGVVERPLGFTHMEDFLADRAPLEPSFEANIEYSREFLKNKVKICDLKAFQPLLARGNEEKKFFDNRYIDYFYTSEDAQSLKEYLKVNITTIPYIRTISAMYVLHYGKAQHHAVYLRD